MDGARMRELLARLSCPLCGGTHGDTLLVVIDSPGPGLGAVRAQCVRCHLFWSFSLDAEPGGDGTAPERPSPRAARGPITGDELIEVHLLLRGYRGSLDELMDRAS